MRYFTTIILLTVLAYANSDQYGYADLEKQNLMEYRENENEDLFEIENIIGMHKFIMTLSQYKI